VRAALAAVVLSACYSPDLPTCTVHCGPDSPCPNEMTCAADLHCHASGDTDVCPRDFLVKVRKSGTGSGQVMSDIGIDCGDVCAASADDGESVLVTAASDDGSRFAGWSGACTGTDPCMLTVTRDLMVGATFNLAHTLSVTFVGAGTGRVHSEPAGISCDADCSALFDAGAAVMLFANADGEFVGWEMGPCSGKGPCVVTLAGDVTVTAHFE